MTSWTYNSRDPGTDRWQRCWQLVRTVDRPRIPGSWWLRWTQSVPPTSSWLSSTWWTARRRRTVRLWTLLLQSRRRQSGSTRLSCRCARTPQRRLTETAPKPQHHSRRKENLRKNKVFMQLPITRELLKLSDNVIASICAPMSTRKKERSPSFSSSTHSYIPEWSSKVVLGMRSVIAV